MNVLISVTETLAPIIFDLSTKSCPKIFRIKIRQIELKMKNYAEKVAADKLYSSSK